MSSRTSIEWTQATWNPIRGCSRVSKGCGNCYAERVAARFSAGPYRGIARMTDSGPRWTGEVRFVEEKLLEPLHWRRPRRIFVNSMSDLFHEKVSAEWIDRIFAVMALSPQHKFQVLTKRPDWMNRWCLAATTPARVWMSADRIASEAGVSEVTRRSRIFAADSRRRRGPSRTSG